MPLSFLISFLPSIYVAKCSNARGLARLGLVLQPTGINFFSAKGISRARSNASGSSRRAIACAERCAGS